MSNYVNLLDIVYPVGSIYHSMNSTSPATSIGGTWTAIKTFLLGSTTSGKTGGEEVRTLTINEMPAHSHAQYVTANSGNESVRSDYSRDQHGLIYPQGCDTGTTGGKHTTICRPTRLASFGTEQLSRTESKPSKRGGVCLTTLTSWTSFTQWVQFISQTIQQHQQTLSEVLGQKLHRIHSSALGHQMQRVEQMLKSSPLAICHRTFGLRVELAKTLVYRQHYLHCLVQLPHLVLKHLVLQMTKLNNIVMNLSITVRNIELLTSITAQPSLLGGVA